MKRYSLWKNPVTLGLATLLGCAIASEPLVAIAQQYIPPRRGIPGRREGAGTRDPFGSSCVDTPIKLVALMPPDQFGATLSNRPTFFWYVSNASATASEFRLKDENDADLLVKTIPMKGRAGIVSFQLPENVANLLEPQRDYHWQVSLVCDPDTPSANPTVEGIVQRVQPNAAMADAVAKAKGWRELTTLYAEKGLWHDALQTLAEQRCVYPNDVELRASWTTLLRSAQLDGFTQASLAATCSAFKELAAQ
jgi:Domain of Unknown Function (DUF928)